MLARRNEGLTGKELPQNWCEGVNDILRKLHLEHCEKQDRVFDTYGMIFANELLLTVSFVNHAKAGDSPVTYLASVDIDEKSDIKKLLESMVDAAGFFYDQYFSQAGWNHYFDMWQEETFNKQKLFHKVTRENIRLTLEAEKLLNN